MGMKLGCFFQEFSVDRMLNFSFYSNDDGFIHFAAADNPDSRFPKISI
jgi:hypothetical protein